MHKWYAVLFKGLLFPRRNVSHWVRSIVFMGVNEYSTKHSRFLRNFSYPVQIQQETSFLFMKIREKVENGTHTAPQHGCWKAVPPNLPIISSGSWTRQSKFLSIHFQEMVVIKPLSVGCCVGFLGLL